MISVLFTQKRSIYHELNQDCWDETRDARRWPGGNAIITHPPCRAWGNYRHKSRHSESEKQLAIFSIHKIRLWGGILEHPRTSKIWKELQLPKPGQPDLFGGFTIAIKQSWFGHKAEKETILYIVGITEKQLPPIPITFDLVPNTIEKMSKNQREHTPIKLAKWLILTTNLIEQNKTNGQPKQHTWTLTQET